MWSHLRAHFFDILACSKRIVGDGDLRGVRLFDRIGGFDLEVRDDRGLGHYFSSQLKEEREAKPGPGDGTAEEGR